jgi:hypothetical protein
MNPRTPIDPRMQETLSAYLDGHLPDAERSVLEKRLRHEEDLRRQLDELRAVRDSLRSLPVLKTPRPLTLPARPAGVSSRRLGLFSQRPMAWGSALASLAFVVVLAADVFSRGSVFMAADTQPAAPAMLQAPGAGLADESEPSIGDTAGAGGGETPRMAPRAATAAESAPATFAEATPAMPPAPNAEPVTEQTGEGCVAQLTAEKSAERCAAVEEDAPAAERLSFSLPGFQTAAPFLEVFFGLSAILLAGLAFLRRRPR